MARLQRLDRDLNKYLIPGEHVVVACRQHWFSLLKPISLVALLFVLAVFIDVEAPSSRGGQGLANLGWGALLISVGWLGWRLANWSHDWFVATDKRFLLFYGFIRRRVAMMPLSKVTDMTFDRSILGRIVGYGTFILESAGQDQALSQMEFVPDADENYRRICAQLFGSPAAASPARSGPSGPSGPDLGPDDGDDWDDPDDDGDPWDDSPDPGGSPRGAARRQPRPIRGPRQPHSSEDNDDDRMPRARGGHAAYPHDDQPSSGEHSIYRSDDLVRAARDDDTGEIPVVRARPMRRPSPRPRRATPENTLYVPRDWAN